MGGFPFSAVMGADEAKLALILAALDQGIGGVLLRGEKGSAKSTLARGLASLLPGDAPFVDLPVGATEDRVVGSIDLAAALAGEGITFRPGLLAEADGGVLYVDEVNLLPDHLVDVLLDAAASGVNRVQREGVAHTHPARFILIGSMNPEEGELRPQFLDRFGLAVDLRASRDAVERAEAVRRRLSFDRDPAGAAAGWADEERHLAEQLAATVAGPPAAVAPDLLERISRLCLAAGVEGLRADLVICRAAAALAAWEGKAEATTDEVRRVAPLALAHRAHRAPAALDEALGEALKDGAGGQPPVEESGEGTPPGEGPAGGTRVAPPAPAGSVVRLAAPATSGPGVPGRRSVVEGSRGRLVGDRPAGPGGPASVAVAATVREVALRHAADPSDDRPAIAGDLREAVRTHRAGNLIVLAVDASGSMGAPERMEAAKGAVIGLLIDAYQRRDRVALVTFGGGGAEVVLRPTGSVEIAKARLAALPTGGRTPLAEGIEAALTVAAAPATTGHRPLLVLVTDGRATAAPPGRDPVVAALAAAAGVRQRGIPAVVVDVEAGPTRLGLAGRVAEAMGAPCLTLGELSAAALTAVVREAVPVR
jgi:magnesium chelatase subunit D